MMAKTHNQPFCMLLRESFPGIHNELEAFSRLLDLFGTDGIDLAKP